MKYIVPILLCTFLLFGCSKSDSVEKIEEVKLELPKLTTTTVSDITETAAKSGGNVTDDGGAPVTSRGICWSTSQNPTIADEKTSDGSGVGEFTSTLSNLTVNTTYYTRAYATNSEGTAYGNQQEFATPEVVVEQKIFEGDVILTTQEEVDDFGSEDYSVIAGNLIIKDNNDPSTIENVDALDSLEEIRGYLTIEGNDTISSLSGLEGLEKVEGWDGININSNPLLTMIGPFENLSIVEGSIKISSSNDDAIVVGFSRVTEVNSLVFNLETEFFFKEINAFQNLEAINATFGVRKILSLNSFPNLEKVVSNIQIYELPNVENLTFLNKLTFVQGIVINENPNLKNFVGLENIKQILSPGLSISKNSSLESFSGLNNLEIIEGDFDLHENNQLKNYEGLNSLGEIGGLLSVIGNSNLMTLNGLENLMSCGRITARNNLQLASFCGLQNLFEMGWNGEVTTSDNAYNPTYEDLSAGDCEL